jgi:hypothetical protein
MNPSRRAKARPARKALRAPVVVIWVALAAATLTACQGSATKTSTAPPPESSPAAPATPAATTIPTAACVAHQHANRAASHART